MVALRLTALTSAAAASILPVHVAHRHASGTTGAGDTVDMGLFANV